MAEKRLTSADVVEQLVEKTRLSVEQVKAVLQAQAELAYAEVEQGFPVPGIGRLSKVDRPARKMVMQFGPRKGQEILVPSKKQLNFRISRIAKEMVLDKSLPMPDIFKSFPSGVFHFSTEAKELADPSMFTSGLGAPFTLVRGDQPESVITYRLPDLRLPTGKIRAGDLMIGGGEPYSRKVARGSYPLAVVRAGNRGRELVALVVVKLSNEPVVKWEMAVPEGQDVSQLKQGQFVGYGVDSGTGSLGDSSVQSLITEAESSAADIQFFDLVMDEMTPIQRFVHVDSPNGSLAIFSSGGGDGSYASYFGLDKNGNAAVLVTDFQIVRWGATLKN